MFKIQAETHLRTEIDHLLEKILQERKKITTVKPADDDKKDLVSSLITEYTKMRGRRPIYNYLSSGIGNGPLTQMVDGSIKYDLIGGIGVNLLGHAHPIFIRAHLESALSDTVMCANLQPYPEAIDLTRTLLGAVATSSLRHFWFTGSGSCANDTALKLIWQKKAPAYRIIAFEKCFTGRTVATQDITHNQAYREGMPTCIQVDHVPHFDQSNPDGAIEKTLNALKEVIEAHPGEHAAITLEIMQGEGGFIFGTKEYYEAVFRFAKENGLYIWVDEVQTFARTHQLFAFQTFELDQYVDIVTVGKALQCCGLLFTEELNPKPGLIAGTFNASIASLKAGAMTIKHLMEGSFYGRDGRMAKIEETFLQRIRFLASSRCKGKIGYSGGLGTMIAFEVGQGTKEDTDKFLNKLFDNGVLAFSAGKSPTRVRFLLPIILEDRHIDEIFHIIEKTVMECF